MCACVCLYSSPVTTLCCEVIFSMAAALRKPLPLDSFRFSLLCSWLFLSRIFHINLYVLFIVSLQKLPLSLIVLKFKYRYKTMMPAIQKFLASTAWVFPLRSSLSTSISWSRNNSYSLLLFQSLTSGFLALTAPYVCIWGKNQILFQGNEVSCIFKKSYSQVIWP